MVLIAQEIGDSQFFYSFNAHGDVVQRIQANGAAAPRYDYDAFGNQKSTLDTDPNPFRYCGEYWDSETSNVYLRNRYYDTKTGRFIGSDPAHSGTNWYRNTSFEMLAKTLLGDAGLAGMLAHLNGMQVQPIKSGTKLKIPTNI